LDPTRARGRNGVQCLPLGVIWWLLRRNVDDESPRSPMRWLAIAVRTVIAVGAFVLLMGWVGGEL